MAYNVKAGKRIFKYEEGNTKLELPDPDHNFDPSEVKRFYSNQYPELVNAKITGPVMSKGVATYEFGVKVGSKG